MRRDDAYLLDILLAARQAMKFMEGVSRSEFEDNELVQNAVMWPLEIIGAASAKLTSSFRRSHPQIPWHEIIGTRNRLVHEYFCIDYGAMWDTIHNDLPVLVKLIEPLVPKEDQT